MSDLEDYDAFESLTQTLDAEILAQQEERARVMRYNINVTDQDHDDEPNEESEEEPSLESELVDELDPDQED